MYKDQHTDMGSRQLARLMQAVPAFTEVTIVLQSGQELRGMAREMPTTDEERRWTVDGREWFIDADSLKRVGVRKVVFDMPTIEMVHF